MRWLVLISYFSIKPVFFLKGDNVGILHIYSLVMLLMSFITEKQANQSLLLKFLVKAILSCCCQ